MKLARIEKAQSVFYFSYLTEEDMSNINFELDMNDVNFYNWAFDEDNGLQLLAVDMDYYLRVKTILHNLGADFK